MSIRKNYKAFKRNIKKFLKSRAFRAKFKYVKYSETLPINERAILFESYTATSFSGSCFYIYEEILKDSSLKDYKKYITVKKNKREQVKNLLESHGYHDYVLVEEHSTEFCKALATAKYLFNNSTFPTYFIKRNEQVYFNTWHGTPLKTLGRSIKSAPHEIGNTQRNFFMADYLLYPNEFMFGHMRKDYMLNELFPGNYVLNGYPRNYVFYDIERQKKVREALEISDMQVICYMPTWRGTTDKKEVRTQELATLYYLNELDRKLQDNQVLFVNLHNFIRDRIKLDDYKHIRFFPEEYETYEFLSCADCLITDYSSVFFDFANTRRKIILFGYDKEEYFEDRGVYISYDSLPFPIVETVPALLKEINDPKVKDYTSFTETYCPWDYQDSAKFIVENVFHDKDSLNLIAGPSFSNHKENIVIFGGALTQNGLTTSLRGLLNHIDTEKANFFVLFYRKKAKKHIYVINNFPKEINYISIQGPKTMSFTEAICQALYFRFNCTSDFVMKHVNTMYKREVRRIFGPNHFDTMIHFTGYERNIAMLMNNMQDTKRIMYVHNDMSQEQNTRSNYHIPSIFQTYKVCEEIVPVRESLKSVLLEMIPDLDPDKIVTVHNVNNIEPIKENAKHPLTFEDVTFSTHTVVEINKILNDDKIFKFVNVARFSPEKGLKRLIAAFELFHQKYHNTVLFIIGGHGSEFDEILQYVEDHQLTSIVLIKSLSNPFPIVSRCNTFILSSFYEGLPMSIMEALILGVPVVSTDIAGPREFLSQGYGELVSDSQKGVYDGLEKAYKHELQVKPFDAEAFNERALKEFYDAVGL